MKLNGNEYKLPENINFGFIYRANNLLRKNGSGILQLLGIMESGDFFTGFPLMGAIIAGMNANIFMEEVDKHIAKGGDMDSLIEEVTQAFIDFRKSASLEGFLTAALNKMPGVIQSAMEEMEKKSK